jgi:cytochrome c oxidase cbb3-type subunit 1
MKNGAAIVFVGLFTLLALTGAGLAADDLFRQHMWVLVFVLAVSLIVLLRQETFKPAAPVDQSAYMDGPVRFGAIATMFWGVVGFLVGVVIALQLAYPHLNIEPWFNFGRMRPLHTSAVIFAFGGNALIATSFYVVQRTSHARLFGGDLAWFVFWGYQLFIIMAATGYLLGITQSKEYAEPEWYADLWLTIVWVAYLLVFLVTVLKRKEPHLYVANWFYLAFIITVAVLHLGNNISIPTGLFDAKSYSTWAGVQRRPDPMVVRPQCGGLLPDRRLPWHDVLFCSQAGEPPGLFVPAVDRPLLGADLPLHLGWSAPSPLHGVA